MEIRTYEQLAQAVPAIVGRQPVTDMHTHLYSPEFGELLLHGVDELLTYHYLVAEVMRCGELTPEAFWRLDKAGQAEAIWRQLFVQRTPLSEACRGVLTSLAGLGCDLRARELAAFRAAVHDGDVGRQVERVLDLAGIDHVVMTNDPFDEDERGLWERGVRPSPRFHAALRLDALVNEYAGNRARLRGWGYAVEDAWSEPSAAEVRRFLRTWIGLMKPVYMAVSLPPTFAYPEDSDRGRLLAECVLPVAREAGLPFAMMVGVKRGVNPALRGASDGVATASLEPLERLLRTYPGNKFMATYLARENQHELNVLARKFSNLLPFGCWWFLNNPVLIEEMTRMRLELLGPSFVPQHSDARVLEQLIYKWRHSREVLVKVLIDKYADLLRTGWVLTVSELERDAADLLRNNFWRFAGRPDMV